MAELTPMMRQYMEIKNKYQDYVLFYRLGDFYEMFFDDAVFASKELELTLTGRDCGQKERAPMCGVPYHSAEAYIARLVRGGYKVAVCEQVEDPKTAKGLVRREIVRMVTPGTVIESSMLDEDRNNFLACVYQTEAGAGLCFADISTGEVHATALPAEEAMQTTLNGELGRFVPRETLLGGTAPENQALNFFLKDRLDSNIEPLPDGAFDAAAAERRIRDCFGDLDFVSEGLADAPLAVQSVGGLLSYLEETQRPSLRSLNTLEVYRQGQYMELDLTARRNLELTETMRTNEKRGSLLWVLDHTETAMGSRLLRQWLEKPLLNPIHIRRRQDAVRELLGDVRVRGALGEQLGRVFDIERLVGRVVYGTAGCRDLRSMCATIAELPAIWDLLSGMHSALLRELQKRLDPLTDLGDLIDRAIVEEPPATLREGGYIRAGYSPEVDELRDLASGGKGKIAQIERQEREKTGIKTLKVGYNRVFGYYIEVSRANSDAVPEHYIRKQTLANCERYITEELKVYENTVLSAQDKLIALENQLFDGLREQIAGQVHRIQRTAQSLANLDVLRAFAVLAEEGRYVCPDVDFSGRIHIQDGRHPVVERVLQDQLFIANDTLLDDSDNRVAVITGPNMAGKSTYMRQVALITIMAQIGSFVPASSAQIGVADRVFTRVGASDDLTSGQSTFMVEMTEVADILKNATKNSLIVLDEIGRGTSTYDGMAIARAVVEYAAKKIGARTLFATHYHELTALETLLDGVKNYNIAVKKRGEDIIFLRKIVRGGADDSYGIEVAGLAGVPHPVIRRAKAILRDLERSAPKIEVREVPEEEEPQISLASLGDQQVVERLRAMQVETMTPMEAMNALFELKTMVK